MLFSDQNLISTIFYERFTEAPMTYDACFFVLVKHLKATQARGGFDLEFLYLVSEID